MVDEKVIEAFYMMWDSFPGNVRLIHKNKTVLAANKYVHITLDPNTINIDFSNWRNRNANRFF